MTNELHLRSVQVSYDGITPVFAPVTERMVSGEIVAVTGMNGAGKSTLLAGICGLLRPSDGHVTFRCDGTERSDEQLRARCGYASPGMNLYEDLQAWEHVEFDAKVRGRMDMLKHAEQSLESFRLRSRSGSVVRDFSTGMKQRLKIILATYFHPDLLLLDEPTSNLDDEGFAVVAQHIRSASDRGCIVLIATNDERDRALCMREFRLSDHRQPKESLT